MLAFLLITAHLSVPANDQRLMIASPVPTGLAEIKAQTARHFQNVGELRLRST